MKKLFILFSAIMAFFWSAHAADLTGTFDFSNPSTLNPAKTAGTTVNDETFTDNDISLTTGKGSTAHLIHSDGHLRFYTNGKLTISCSDKYLLSNIEFTFTSSTYNTLKLSSTQGTATNLDGTKKAATGSWSAGTDEVKTIDFTAVSAQSRIKKVVVTYIADPSKSTPDNTKTDSGLAFAKVTDDIYFADADTYTMPALSVADGYDGTISYVSDNTDVASFSDDGKISINGIGTAKITASATETDNFNASSASYTLTVIDQDNPEITFDFANPSTLNPAASINDIADNVTFTMGPVSFIATKGSSTSSKFYSGNLRVYTGANATISCDEKYVLTDIAFTFDSSNNKISSPSTGTLNISNNSGSWSADNSNPVHSVVFPVSGTTRLVRVTVCYKRDVREPVIKFAQDITLAVGEEADAPALTDDSTQGLTLSYAVAQGGEDFVSVDAQTGKIKGLAVTAEPVTIIATSAEQSPYVSGTGSFTVTVKSNEHVDAPTFAADQETSITTLDKISLSCEMSGVSIMYVVDDNEPKLYTEPFALSAGTHTVYAYSVKNEFESEHTATLTFTVAKASPELKWSAESYDTSVNESSHTYPTLSNPHNLAVTYTSSDTKIASISEDGIITLLKKGATIISATYAEDETFEACEASYTLNVTTDVIHVLNADNLGVKQDYATEYTAQIDGATYTFKGYLSNNKLQFNNNNSNSNKTCGFIIVETPGDIAKLTFDTTIASKSGLYVYGSTTPYKSTSDLYETTTQGTLLQTITASGTYSYDFTEEQYNQYKYIGIASYATGANQICPITITYRVTKCKGVTFDVADNSTIYAGNKVTMATNTTDATIKYKVNDGDEQTYDSETGLVFDAADEYTVEAWATKEDLEDSDHTTVKFIVKSINSIAEWLEIASGDNSKAYLISNPVTVTYRNGRDMFVKDESGSLMLNNASKDAFADYNPGDVLTGLCGSYGASNGMPQMNSNITIADKAEGTAPEAETVKVTDFNDYSQHTGLLGKYIKVESLTIASQGSTTTSFNAVDNDGNTIVVWNRYNSTGSYDATVKSPEVGKRYDMTGVVYCYATSSTNYMELVLTADPAECAKTPVVLSWNGITDGAFSMTYGAEVTLPTLAIDVEAAASVVTYTSSDESVATIENGVIKVLKAGETTITAAIPDANTFYKADAAAFALTVAKADAGLAWKIEGDTYTTPYINNIISVEIVNPNNITLSEDNLSIKNSKEEDGLIGLEDGGMVSILETDPDTYTVSYVFAGNDCYNAQTITFKLIIEKLDAGLAWKLEGDTYTTPFVNDIISVEIDNPNKITLSEDNLSIKNSKDEDGLAELEDGIVSIWETNPDTYTVSYVFAGNDIYNEQTITFTLVIEPRVETTEHLASLPENTEVEVSTETEVMYRYSGDANSSEIWLSELLNDGSEYNVRVNISSVLDNDIVKTIKTGTMIKGFKLNAIDATKATNGTDKVLYVEATMTSAPTACIKIDSYEYGITTLGDEPLTRAHLGQGVIVKGTVSVKNADSFTISAGDNSYKIQNYFIRPTAETSAPRRAEGTSADSDYKWLATTGDWDTGVIPEDKDIYVRGIVDKASDGTFVVYPTQMSTLQSFTTTDVRDLLLDNEFAVKGNTIIAPEGSMIFTLNGMRVNGDNLASGIYIVRFATGKSVKVAIK